MRRLGVAILAMGLILLAGTSAWAESVNVSGPPGWDGPAVRGDGFPDVFYDQATGKLSVDLEGSDMFSIQIPGPQAASVDDWQEGEFLYKCVWTQMFFDDKEQWAATNSKSPRRLPPDDQNMVFQIATYAPGLTRANFPTNPNNTPPGGVEMGFLTDTKFGAISYTDVTIVAIPEPGTLALLLGGGLIGLVWWRRRAG